MQVIKGLLLECSVLRLQYLIEHVVQLLIECLDVLVDFLTGPGLDFILDFLDGLEDEFVDQVYSSLQLELRSRCLHLLLDNGNALRA